MTCVLHYLHGRPTTTAFTSSRLIVSNQDFFSEIKEQLRQYAYSSAIFCQQYIEIICPEAREILKHMQRSPRQI